MGYPGNNVISGPISTTSSTDTYATHISELGKGGWRSVSIKGSGSQGSGTGLYAIPLNRLEAGSAAYVWNDSTGSNNGLYLYLNSAWTQTSLSSTTYVLPIASTSVLGGVKIPSGGVITIDGDGDIDVQKATADQFGVVKLGTGLTLDGDNKLYVTAANLTVKKDANSFGSYPILAFTGNGVSVSNDSTNSQNKVEINLPKAGVENNPSFEEFNRIVFKSASTSLTVAGATSGSFPDKTYTVELTLSGSGTLKQNLYELDDVGTGSGSWGTAPTNGQVLKYDSGTSTWKPATHPIGIQFGDLQATTPLAYSTTTPTGKGTFSIPKATTDLDGYLSSDDWDTFKGKQDALQSGVNIKTINGQSLLGSSNIVISGGSGSVTSVAFTTNSNGTNIGSSVTNPNSAVEITLSIPTASAANRGALSSADWTTFNNVTNKLNITAGTSGGTGNITLDFANADTIYGTVVDPVTGTIGVNLASAKVGVTHIVVHKSSTPAGISGALKLSGSGNYKLNVTNYIYFTYISGSTVIYSINQA
jgi:hypothetical protein